MIVEMPLEEAPKWMSCIEMTRDPDGRIRLRLVKTNGEDYGFVLTTEEEIIRAMGLV